MVTWAGTNSNDLWNELLNGVAGENDTLTGGAGIDVLDGGGGSDVATYSANANAYRISFANGVMTIADIATNGLGGDGVDTLRNIEALSFIDKAYTITPGSEFRVNTTTSDNQSGGRMTVLPDGSWVAVWHSALQDGSSWGIYAQRYV